MPTASLSLVDWRVRVAEMYAAARGGPSGDPAAAHAAWRTARDDLFRGHAQSPLPAGDPLREQGLPYWDHDPAYRFEVALRPVAASEDRVVDAGADGSLAMAPVGRVELPDPVGASLDVWWLRQYGGGLFVPLRDGTSGTESYGGGRYLLDTAKGAWLGGAGDRIVLDLNYAYHPSCRYDPAWQCPLAPAGNTTDVPVRAGERLAHG